MCVTIISLNLVLILYNLTSHSYALYAIRYNPIITTVGFHNLNLRIFNLRVSNPNKLIVDVFFDTISDFNVPGSRPKKHDEISEIDRMAFQALSANGSVSNSYYL